MLARPIVWIIDYSARRVRFYLVAVDYPLKRTAPIYHVFKTARRYVAYLDIVIVNQSSAVVFAGEP